MLGVDCIHCGAAFCDLCGCQQRCQVHVEQHHCHGNHHDNHHDNHCHHHGHHEQYTDIETHSFEYQGRNAEGFTNIGAEMDYNGRHPHVPDDMIPIYPSHRDLNDTARSSTSESSA